MPDQYRVAVRTQHQHEGTPCQHTEYRPARSLGEALALAVHPPLSVGYMLISTEIQYCTAWRKYELPTHLGVRDGP